MNNLPLRLGRDFAFPKPGDRSCPATRRPVDDTLFLLNDVFDYRALRQSAGLLRGAARRRRSGAERRRPSSPRRCCSRSIDRAISEGCTRHAGRLGRRRRRASRRPTRPMPRAAGSGSPVDPAYGGQGLPHFLAVALSEYHDFRQSGLRDVSGPDERRDRRRCSTHGGDAHEARYLPKMTTGEWTGTMNLTEPHCGTDLGLIKTRAAPPGRRLLSRSPVRRSSSRPASTISPTTSSISCSRASTARRPGRQGHLAVRRAEDAGRRRRLARRAATASPAARSSTRWASTAIRPAC